MRTGRSLSAWKACSLGCALLPLLVTEFLGCGKSTDVARSCGKSTDVKSTVVVRNCGSPQACYTSASAACAAMPIRETGTKYYFCDCAAGSEQACVAGDDSRSAAEAQDPATPWQSWDKAVDTFDHTLSAGDTIAFCKGGAWAVSDTQRFGNTRCRADPSDYLNAASTYTCDIRDYDPPWGGKAKPILSSSSEILISFQESTHDEGVRILNLDIRGNGTGPGGTKVGGWAFWLYGSHTDYLLCNNSFDGWGLAIDLQSNKNGRVARVHVVGNRVTNSVGGAVLAAASDSSIDSNFWDNNGSSNTLDHTLYLGGESTTEPVTTENFQVVNNEIRFSGSTPCRGLGIVFHGQWDGVNIENNIVDGGSLNAGSCWGIAVGNGGYESPGWYCHLAIRRNVVLNSGNLAIGVEEAPGAVIENNVVVSSMGARGIVAPIHPARTNMGEPITQDVIIRNNTLYFPAGSKGSTGAIVGTAEGDLPEGSGYVIANNSVYFGDVDGTCFSTKLAAGAYAFIGNNACYGGMKWGTDYDATNHVIADPMYAAAPGDLSPRSGSPLLGAGSAAHAPAVDLLLHSRPNPPSIGAYEGAGR